MRRFEFREGTSSKFWEVTRKGKSVTVRFGRIGTDGQTQTKAHASDDAAKKALEKLVAEKIGKGYVEDDASAEVATPKKGSAEKPAKKAATKEAGWLDAGGGYELSLTTGKLVARKNGQSLASVPKALKEGDVAERLLAAAEFLDAHARSCIETVESWMLRSLATPRGVLEAVFEDEAWRLALENAIVVPVGKDGKADAGSGGFFRGVSAKGVGVVDREGETVWIDAPSVMVPHPIALGQLDDLRALATELALKQGIAQLFRETFTAPPAQTTETAMTTLRNGKFEELNHALGHCRKLGYRVAGGSAITRVWEKGRVFEARYWIGDEDPSYETQTGDLTWVDDKQRSLTVGEVPSVAFSEGMRMANAIYAKRALEKKEDDDV